MMYARGTHSKAVCDRCGGVLKYGTLKPEYKNNRRTGLFTCDECWDGEHPQDLPPRHRSDAEALRNPRPRNDIAAPGDSPAENNAFQPSGGIDYEAWARLGE